MATVGLILFVICVFVATLDMIFPLDTVFPEDLEYYDDYEGWPHDLPRD